MRDAGVQGIAPVGSFPANGYGLYDMAGQRLGMDHGLASGARQGYPFLGLMAPQRSNPSVLRFCQGNSPCQLIRHIFA